MPDRFVRSLPSLLEELAPTRVPDYVDDLLGRTARSPQRPRWSFPERWFPVAAVTPHAVLAPGIPWRAIGPVALLLLALVVAGLIAAGSERRVPEPFGLARNGLVAYATGGDIYVADPATGDIRAIVSSAEEETGPIFSPDGTRLAFRRSDRLVVSTADGADPVVVTDDRVSFRDVVQWAPDSRSLLVYRWSRQVVELYAAARDARPKTLATGGSLEPDAFRPPDGGQILVRRQDVGRVGLYLVNVDGTGVEPLIELEKAAQGSGDPLRWARWSPDGAMVAFMNTSDTPESQRSRMEQQSWIEVMNADGTGRRRLSGDSGAIWEFNPSWSPDGTRIAFERWPAGGGGVGAGVGMSAGVVDVHDGTFRTFGPADGTVVGVWSPDGTRLLGVHVPSHRLIVIDPDDGTWQDLSGSADAPPTWQRLAP